MPATTNRKTKHRSRAEPLPPLSWADVVSIQDSFGMQPVPPGDDAGEEAARLHSIYTDWVQQSGTNTTRRYVMPLSTAYMWLRDHYDFLPRHEAGHEARRVLVDGLNDPESGLVVVLTPSSALRRRRP